MRALLPLLWLLTMVDVAHADGQVTVYRCVDARGKVALRDTPCAAGQTQQVRSMLRPRDPPPRAPSAAPVLPPPAPIETRVVVVQAPQPMYVCTTPDGRQYTSATPEGNPRWVPLWTLGVPVQAETVIYRPGSARLVVSDGRVGGHVSTGGIERVLLPTAAGLGAGTWVRDACAALPQAEVCDRLRDRRSALERRIFNAQPSERARLSLEQRGIDARLQADCR